MPRIRVKVWRTFPHTVIAREPATLFAWKDEMFRKKANRPFPNSAHAVDVIGRTDSPSVFQNVDGSRLESSPAYIPMTIVWIEA